VLEPIWEAELEPNAYGYRPRKSALGAIRKVEELLHDGYTDGLMSGDGKRAALQAPVLAPILDSTGALRLCCTLGQPIMAAAAFPGGCAAASDVSGLVARELTIIADRGFLNGSADPLGLDDVIETRSTRETFDS
jgi:hypothetical protein